MNQFCLLILLLSSCFLNATTKAKKYDLAICAITRDDAPYLKEWVDFHLHQGVQHFYIYDNLSKDSPEKVLADHVKRGTVEIIKWNIDHRTRGEWLECQTGAYTDCATQHKNAVKWCAFIDTDEFLFCPSGKKLTAFLKGFDAYQQIAVNWLIFGTSRIQKAQPGKLIQQLLYRGDTSQHNNCKSIVRLDDALKCPNPHFFLTTNQDLMVDPDKQPKTVPDFIKKPSGIESLRINHYMFRDLDFFYNRKLSRIQEQGKYTKLTIEFENNFNKVLDKSILKCLPKHH